MLYTEDYGERAEDMVCPLAMHIVERIVPFLPLVGSGRIMYNTTSVLTDSGQHMSTKIYLLKFTYKFFFRSVTS